MKTGMMILTATLALTSMAETSAVEVAPATQQPATQPKTPEAQRAEARARRQKFMAERKAAMEAKMLEVIKKYVADEAQAKALVKELQEAVFTNRRLPPGHPLPPPSRPAQ